MSRWLCAFLIGLGSVLTLVGCGDDRPTAPTDPTPPVEVTQVFSGTLTRNDAETHPFTVDRAGEITATLTALTGGTTNIGLALGTWNGQVCQIILANDKAPVDTKVTGTAGGPGNFCVRVYDIGEITDVAPASYTVTITHF